MAEAEPDGTLFHGAQSLMHQRRTVSAGPGGDAIVDGQGIADLRGIVVPDVQGHDGAAFRLGKVTINGDARDLPNLTVKFPHQRLLRPANGIQPGFLQIGDRSPQTRQTVGIQGSGFQGRGHLGRMGAAVGLDTAAAGEQGPDGDDTDGDI